MKLPKVAVAATRVGQVHARPTASRRRAKPCHEQAGSTPATQGGSRPSGTAALQVSTRAASTWEGRGTTSAREIVARRAPALNRRGRRLVSTPAPACARRRRDRRICGRGRHPRAGRGDTVADVKGPQATESSTRSASGDPIAGQREDRSRHRRPCSTPSPRPRRMPKTTGNNAPRIAVIGPPERRQVRRSSNAARAGAGEIVSDKPGTPRDADPNTRVDPKERNSPR